MSESYMTPESGKESFSDNDLVDQVKIELTDIDQSDLSEHPGRFEALHGKLQEALSSIDGL